MNKNIFSRTIEFIGEDNFDKISNLTIAVIGVGGVGGTAVEALARTGFKNFILVDFDSVDETNLNRQILYTIKDVNKVKVESAVNHLKEINPDINATTLNIKIDNKSINELNKYHIDFIVDAIDDINGKVAISKYAISNHIPLIISLGMAKRMDPSKVFITRLDKTTNDPLARKLRYEMKHNNIDTKQIMTVASSETPIDCANKLPSLITVPSSAGLNIANYIISYFINKIL